VPARSGIGCCDGRAAGGLLGLWHCQNRYVHGCLGYDPPGPGFRTPSPIKPLDALQKPLFRDHLGDETTFSGPSRGCFMLGRCDEWE